MNERGSKESLRERLLQILSSSNSVRWYNELFTNLSNDELRLAFEELEPMRNGDGVLQDGVVRTVHSVLFEAGLFTSSAPMIAQDIYYEIARRVYSGEFDVLEDSVQ